MGTGPIPIADPQKQIEHTNLINPQEPSQHNCDTAASRLSCVFCELFNLVLRMRSRFPTAVVSVSCKLQSRESKAAMGVVGEASRLRMSGVTSNQSVCQKQVRIIPILLPLCLPVLVEIWAVVAIAWSTMCQTTTTYLLILPFIAHNSLSLRRFFFFGAKS